MTMTWQTKGEEQGRTLLATWGMWNTIESKRSNVVGFLILLDYNRFNKKIVYIQHLRHAYLYLTRIHYTNAYLQEMTPTLINFNYANLLKCEYHNVCVYACSLNGYLNCSHAVYKAHLQILRMREMYNAKLYETHTYIYAIYMYTIGHIYGLYIGLCTRRLLG